jgi:predicted glycosyltransferase
MFVFIMLRMKKLRQKRRVFFDLNHPADFHFFKHLIIWMRSQDYVIKIVARDKECLHMLLDDAGLNYTSRGSGKHTLQGKYLYAVWILLLLLVELIRFRPTIAMSLSSPYLAVLTRILRIACVTFDDTDNNPRLLPLIKKSTYLLSPATYPYKFHKGHFHLPALKELAYLHPTQFQHSHEQAGVFLRITRTDSIHHTDASVLDQHLVIKKMKQLSKSQTIFLSSETGLALGNEKAIHRANPIRIHKNLAQCRVFWGNSATMAAEAAVLGIPAIFISAEKFAYISELESYGLLYHYHPDDIYSSLEKLNSILSGDPPTSRFKKSREILLGEKMDMTAFMIWFIDTLPESASTLEKDPAYARKFIADR